MTSQRWVYLASLSDLDDLLIPSDRVHYDWPPPGVEIRYDYPPLPESDDSVLRGGQPTNTTRFYGVGDVPGEVAGDWWVTTVGELVASIVFPEGAMLNRLQRWLEIGGREVTGGVLAYPVIYKSLEGGFMRWIKATVKGSLGAVEIFQFSVNWGKPGDDPDPTPAELSDIGVSLADKFTASLIENDAALGTAPRTLAFGADVVFEELGVALLTQTEQNNVDGTGGNLSQDGETEWALLNGTTGYAGDGGKTLPFEVATCVSFRTATRGASGKGRVYLPPPSINALAASGGVYASNQALGAAHLIGAWFDRVLAGADDIVPVVVSRRYLFMSPITDITVGIVPDSQRRRRWAQLEAPVAAWSL